MTNTDGLRSVLAVLTARKAMLRVTAQSMDGHTSTKDAPDCAAGK